jgi:(2Fe-2S) ferredoxin
MKETIKTVSDDRMAICEACPHHSKNHKTVRPDAHCRMCGCTLSAKTACLSCICPDGKWQAHMTDEQYDEIRKEILNEGETSQA